MKKTSKTFTVEAEMDITATGKSAQLFSEEIRRQMTLRNHPKPVSQEEEEKIRKSKRS